MLVEIFNAAGEPVMIMDATEETIALNVPKGGRFEKVPRERMMPPDPEPRSQEPPP